MSDTVKYILPESEIPKSWYNITADLPEPPPPVLHPGTGEPVVSEGWRWNHGRICCDRP